jgi:hypothetical protein
MSVCERGAELQQKGYALSVTVEHREGCRMIKSL